MDKLERVQSIIKGLERLWDELDDIQCYPEVQENYEALNEVGEAMGSIDNAIDSLKEMNFKVKVDSVDYCIEYGDIASQYKNENNLEEGSDEYDDAIYKEIERVKASLPQTLELEVECELEDLDDVVADAISNETNWLINGCTYTYDVV